MASGEFEDRNHSDERSLVVMSTPFRRINPAFDLHSRQGALVGKLISSFGELEFLLAVCVGHAIGHPTRALRAMFRIKTTTARIEAADALARDTFDALGIATEYAETIGAIRCCLKIRNQYAHCHWAADPMKKRTGLFFANLERTAERTHEWEYDFRHVSLSLLKEQEAYFDYTQQWLYYLERELVRQEKLGIPVFPKPKVRPQPKLHNPPSQHVPPWLAGGRRDRHLRLAQEEEERDRSLGGPKKRHPQARKLSAQQRRDQAMKRRPDA